ncbi:MAG: cytochrome c biogenesis protein CcdA [Chloroflexi bacterium]|nr:cytochrome c biogenesis protein CcdA [Chloroflexota bacterium]
MSTLASVLPLGYAFGAGMVATVNPCGVLLLPSLVAFYLGRGEAAELSGRQRAGKALLLGLMATLGFVALFAAVGLAIGAGGRALIAAFPVGGLLVGVALAGLGAWLALSGRGFGILAASRAMGHVELRDDLRSLFFFGVAYAVTSLACTLPIFLVVAGSALAAGGPIAAAGQFISYALGMGTVLTIVILGAAFFQGLVQRSVRRVVPYVHRLAASFLLGAGIFVVNYWLTTGGLLR